MIGTHDVLPYGGAVIQSGQIILRILEPIDTAKLTLQDRGALTETMHDLIERELGGKTRSSSVQSREQQPDAAA